MEISRALTADLDLLTDALNDPDVDLMATLEMLGADIRAAVPSFVGLSLHITGGPTPFTYTALDRGAEERIATSLLLPLLKGVDDEGRAVSVVLYAATPGAFVDLSADLSWLTGIGSFALDEHLAPPEPKDTLETLHAESLVNQAIGMLIAGGLTPEVASGCLDAIAAENGTDRRSAASSVLRGVDGPGPADEQDDADGPSDADGPGDAAKVG